MKIKLALLTTSLFVYFGTQGVAAQSRAELVEQGLLETTLQEQIRLLSSAVSPELGPTDSLWAVSVYELAQAMLYMEDEEAASTWLRWAAWLNDDWPVNGVRLPLIVPLYEEASTVVAQRPPANDRTLGVTWEWPEDWSASATGSLVVSLETEAQVSVQINGQRPDLSLPIELAVGTHEVRASADGYETVTADLEVLPGVTTVLRLDLLETVDEEVLAAVTQRLVSIQFLRGAESQCVTGVMAGPEQGWVLTPSAPLRGVDSLRALTASGSVLDNVTLERADATLGLAVVSVGSVDAFPLDRGALPEVGEQTWSVALNGCDRTPTVRAGRVAAADGADRFTLTNGVGGGAVVGRTSNLFGVLTSDQSGVSAEAALALVQRAREDMIARAGGPDEGQLDSGGPPWGWIALGAGGVGAAVAALASGGGDNGGPPPPDTGGLIITYPNPTPASFVTSLLGRR